MVSVRKKGMKTALLAPRIVDVNRARYVWTAIAVHPRPAIKWVLSVGHRTMGVNRRWTAGHARLMSPVRITDVWPCPVAAMGGVIRQRVKTVLPAPRIVDAKRARYALAAIVVRPRPAINWVLSVGHRAMGVIRRWTAGHVRLESPVRITGVWL